MASTLALLSMLKIFVLKIKYILHNIYCGFILNIATKVLIFSFNKINYKALMKSLDLLHNSLEIEMFSFTFKIIYIMLHVFSKWEKD